MATYRIVRFYADGRPAETVNTGFTLEQAQRHCTDPATHGEGWFDGYAEEASDDHADCAYCASGEAYEHNPEILDPEEWVCSHYQRKDFPVAGEGEVEHLAHCYVDSPGYWEMEG